VDLNLALTEVIFHDTSRSHKTVGLLVNFLLTDHILKLRFCFILNIT